MQMTSRYLWHTLLLWDWLKNQTWQSMGAPTLWQDPFFGKILSRNTFQNILMNQHIADNNTDYPCDNPNHDPLRKVRSFIQMGDSTFQLVYSPGCDFSYVEACFPFKGRVNSAFTRPTNQLSSTWNCFRYVRQKVVTYVHLIFTLKRTRQDVHKQHKFWIQTTTKLVVGLMDSVHLLDKGHCMYIDQFLYKSRIYQELFCVPSMPAEQCAQIERVCQKHDNCKTTVNRNCSDEMVYCWL